MKISVFITSYNQKDYLVEAIESVLAQTRQPDEIIIADDYSTDGSRQVIHEYAEAYPLIRSLFQPHNVGIPRNKNAGYRAATGDFVTYLDGDDRFLPNKLEVDLETLASHPDADIVFSNFYYIDERGERKQTWDENRDSDVPTGKVYLNVLARDFPRRTIFRNELVRRSALEEVGYMDTQFAMYHDWELRIRLSRLYRAAYAPEPTAEYRRYRGGISSSPPERYLDEVSRVYHKHSPSLRAMPPGERGYVENMLHPWIGHHAWRTVSHALQKRNRRQALKHLPTAVRFAPHQFNVRLAAKLMLPYAATKGFRNILGKI